MIDSFDEVGGHELGEHISDGLFTVLRESAESLLDRFCSFFDVEGVLDNLPGDTSMSEGFQAKMSWFA